MSNVKSGPGDQERLLVRPRRACYLLDCGTTHLSLIAKGELTSLLDGRPRKVTVESINSYIAERLISGNQKTTVLTPRGRGRPRKSARSS
jgi:hypothetical protein